MNQNIYVFSRLGLRSCKEKKQYQKRKADSQIEGLGIIKRLNIKGKINVHYIINFLKLKNEKIKISFLVTGNINFN